MRLRFAECEIDETERTLRRSGRLVGVSPKSFDLLVLLARADGRLVSRERMLDALWPATIVSEAAVSQCVRRARVAVGDDGREARVLETVYRHGFRLKVGVERVASTGGGVQSERLSSDAASSACPALAPRSSGARRDARAPFVGRVAELARLDALLEASLAGRAGLALVSGEPGIGKTRLLDELLARARARGVAAVWGRCHEDAGAPAYWPWAQATRSLLEALPAERRRDVLGDATASLQLAVPSLAALADVRAPGAPPREVSRYELFDHWTRLLARAAPLVVALDDVQWADEGTQDLLRFVARERPPSPILVVATLRDVDVRADRTAADAIQALAATHERIALGALTPAEVGELARTGGGEAVGPDASARLHAQTGGNPYFVLEMVSSRSFSGGVPAQEEALPASLRALVAQRIGRLSPEAVTLLRAAAVLGDELPAALLLALVGRTFDGARSALDALVGAGLLRAPGGGVLRFRHGLLRQVVYETLADAEKAALHERAARAIELASKGDPDAHVEALARHHAAAVELAQRAGNKIDARLARRAVRYAERASRRAAEASAWAESARHAGRALSLLEGVRHPPSYRLAILTALGEAQVQSGALDAGRATLRAAAALARKLRSWPDLARITWISIGRFGRSLEPETAETLALVDAILSAAEVSPDGIDDALLARIAARRALVFQPAVPEPRKQALLETAESRARRSGDRAALSYVLWARHVLTWDPRARARRVAVSRELLGLATEAGDLEIEALARICQIRDAVDACDLAQAERAVDAYAEMADGVRHPVVRSYLLPRRVLLALARGRVAEAERLVLEGLAQPDLHHVRTQVQDPLPLQLVSVRREQGRMAELEGAMQAIVHSSGPFAAALACHALIQAQLGRADVARKALADIAADAFARVAFDHNRLLTFAASAEACALIGDPALGARFYAALLPFEGHAVLVADGLALHDVVSRPLGLAALAQGETTLAIAHLERAKAAYVDMGAAARLAHTELDLARAYAHSGTAAGRMAARSALTSAAEAAARMELAGLVGATGRARDDLT